MVFSSPSDYLSLQLRAHELLRDVPLYDVSTIDLPGGGAGRTIADIRALDSTAEPSRIVTLLYNTRRFLGRIFRWDQTPIRPEQSLLSRLSEHDRLESMVTPGTLEGSFLVLYQFPGEALSEILNATVHGFLCSALTRTPTGYRLYVAVYVLPVSWITRPYLALIQPFRRILYPVLLRRIQRAWIAAYG